ncbi:uncharacterized protein EI90DRAFT_2999708 [Cantharellus anzutake]|uniref:uncharacterized protein n=1 Tax=Cantharellus anzutake TaxID=1750568 RepID=UPI001905A76B|nr:uncharacterized protein EI90DRAFT_2999708 [Cantharellus anzutake]KAF8325802.1 hypothetical protein EI90DRAFT_2999708 [Cantharellus anzutake]
MGVTFLQEVTSVFKDATAPVPLFDSPELPSLSVIDVLGALRLSILLRQIKRHNGGLAGEPKGAWVHDLWLTLVVVFAGEILACAMLTVPPSFMLSPTVILLFIASHIVAHAIPSVLIPDISLLTELPLAILDAATRSMMVCDGTIALVRSSPHLSVQASPMALLVTSTTLGNVGFFIVNVFSMLDPVGWNVNVPPELRPWGWTTMDLWIAPLGTAIYATATQSQAFWTRLPALILGILNVDPAVQSELDAKLLTVMPLSNDDGRSVCFLVVATLFTLRALYNFSLPSVAPKASPQSNHSTSTKRCRFESSSPRVFVSY